MDEEQISPTEINAELSMVKEASEKGRQAWRLLGLRLRSVTPARLLRYLLVLAALTGVFWLLANSWKAILPFFIGAILAYAVLPAVNSLDRIMPRRLAALTVMLSVLAFLALFIALLIPSLTQQYTRLIEIIPDRDQMGESIDKLRSSIEDLPSPLRDAITDSLDNTAVTIRARLESVSNNLPQLAVNALLGLINIIGAIIGLLVLPTWLLIVLSEEREGQRSIDRLLHYRIRSDFWAAIRILDRSFRAFFQRQVSQGLLTGIFLYLVLRLTNALGLSELEFPLVAALLAGLMALIPEIGPIVVVVIFAVAGLLVSPLNSVTIVISYLIVHRLVSGYVEGRSKRKVREIHPAVLIIFVVALSELGLFWLLLSVPIITTLRDLFRYAYGRLSEPPRQAGLLPDETAASLAQEFAAPTPAQPMPLTYRRLQSARAGRSEPSSE